ncbi:MAG: hypothetical protein GTN89_05200 [Acidobacteria bacterium]|nr:hypothetical protein [Acidobacteriota bacterium]NIM61124.1 hypothetical protein [Acidobacteriota bacterium]NIO58714.1 hypothetical protein [Acidobacteriota bacterium]NIQ29765.1 hypothetical protein [Acidobacteriota bacterium]NIQ84485.1 hypothetical protein [Acidobacteriota bacterium]
MKNIEGYRRIDVADGDLWVAEGFERNAEQLRLTDQARWEAMIDAGSPAGRGRIAHIEDAGRHVTLKQLRRGGLAARLWRDRFAVRERLLQNLSLPRLARQRGVATPAALALLVVGGPPGLWRGWLALETVAGGRDLGRLFLADGIRDEEWRVALATVRGLHDAGFEHPDLNLGNLLLDEAGRAWILDLDRCTAHDGAIDVDRRIDALRRIERSYLKIGYVNDRHVDTEPDWPKLYAPGDVGLARRWELREHRDLAKLERHRRGWRR